MRPRVVALLALVVCSIPGLLHAAPPRTRTDDRPLPSHRPTLVQSIDNDKRIDVNQLSMVVTNTGSFAYDKPTGSAGLEFPRGSGRTVVFAGGLWIGAQVGGSTRVAVAEYTDEYLPGQIVSGVPDDPFRSEYKVYKLLRQYATASERDAALADYQAGAVPHGAPVVGVLPDGSLSITGDQMLWAVYNDGNPAHHINIAGGTAPLGVEVQQTTFAFDQPGPLGSAIYIRFKVINRGPNTLQDTYFGAWFDPDLGGFTDDVVGCAPSQGLGFCYNGDGFDDQYGNTPPAFGVSLLQGPEQIPGEARLGATGFGAYTNGIDPNSFVATYNALRGRLADGSLPIDPTTGIPTEFMFSGDPVAGTGWIDPQPADKRMLLSTGPVTIAPGGEQELLIAVIVGAGTSRLGSVQVCKCSEQGVRAFAAAGFTGPAPSPCFVGEPPCTGRPVDYWTQQCGPGAELTDLQMQAIAQSIDQHSAYYQWGGDQRASLCGELAAGDPSNVRAAAQREFSSLMATAAAADLGIHAPNSPGFRLNLARPVSCPSVPASTIGEVIQTAQFGVVANYQDLVPDHTVPIEGFDWGGSSFGGGAGRSVDLFGSSIQDPADFPEVEIRFDHSQPQYAYRYLRRELPGGGSPSVGRGYVYGGFYPVPFSCWDLTHNVQLDVLFLEKVVTADDGTILGPEFQLATFDSTWSPDDSFDGNRELLWVIARPYTGSPLQEIIDNGNPINGVLPSTYVLWARRPSASTVFDDGDRFHFSFSIVPAGVDAELMILANQPQGDPAVLQAYADIAACLHEINANDGRGPGCEGPELPPIANAGRDVTVECTSGAGTSVQLDGRQSAGTDLTYLWSAPGITFDNPTSAQPIGSFPLGRTNVILTVTSNGQTAADAVSITIADNTPPTVSITVQPNRLWPPNHKLVPIHAEVTAVDCDPAPEIRLIGLSSSQPDAGIDPEDVPDDIQGAVLDTPDFDFQLRAERFDADTSRAGRIYTICYEVRDLFSNSTVQCVTVEVPRDLRGRAGLIGAAGARRVIVYGSSRMSVRSVDRTSLAVSSADYQVVQASGLDPVYGDFDGDRIEDALFGLAGELPAPSPGSSLLFVRWLAGAQSYLAEASPSSTTEVAALEIPSRFEAAIAANPAREAGVIHYGLPRGGHVRVGIFDVTGHRVATLVDAWLPAGRHEARFEAGGSQLYLYRVEFEGKTASGKFVVVK